MGKMQEIRELFQAGKTVKEIIEMGYKKPTVYKVNKEPKDSELDKNLNNDNSPDNLDNSDNLDNEEEKTDPDPDPNPDPDPDPEFAGLEQETFGDDENSFQEFGSVDIRRDVIAIPTSPLIPGKSKVAQTGKSGKIGLAELLTEIFSTVGIVSGHDFWELSNKEQKVIKHLCRIPGLEKFLHKFGLYGCVIGLFTITFKRIKKEIQIKKGEEDKKEDAVQKDSPIPSPVRPDTPIHIMAGFVK